MIFSIAWLFVWGKNPSKMFVLVAARGVVLLRRVVERLASALLDERLVPDFFVVAIKFILSRLKITADSVRF
jgi:hypothetical protein